MRGAPIAALAFVATLGAAASIGAADRTFASWVRVRIDALRRSVGTTPSPLPSPTPPAPEGPQIPETTLESDEPAIRGRLSPWPLDGEDPVGTVNGAPVALDGTFAVPPPFATGQWLSLEWKGGVVWRERVDVDSEQGRDLGIVWLPSPAWIEGSVDATPSWLERGLVVRAESGDDLISASPVRADGTFELGPLPPGSVHVAIWLGDQIVGPVTKWPRRFASAPPLELYSDERRDLGVVRIRHELFLGALPELTPE